MRKVYLILFTIMLFCFGCELRLKPNSADGQSGDFTIERYDRIESLYLSTGDYSALQQMNTSYPAQTRMLIEDVLKLGHVNDPEINTKFLNFFQDTTLQTLISDVQHQFANIDDLNDNLQMCFMNIVRLLPSAKVPKVYTQISSLDQSIIVGDGFLGISLDKYLGADYPLYKKYYNDHQRMVMVREMIVPDAVGFYILSMYPFPSDREMTQLERDMHIGKIQWIVNQVMEQKVFKSKYVNTVARYMKNHSGVTFDQLLRTYDHRKIIFG